MFISAGAPIHLKINNDTLPVSTQIIDAATAKKIAYEVMNEEEIARQERDWEMNLSHIEPEFRQFPRQYPEAARQRIDGGALHPQQHSVVCIAEPAPCCSTSRLKSGGLILMVGSTVPASRRRCRR